MPQWYGERKYAYNFGRAIYFIILAWSIYAYAVSVYTSWCIFSCELFRRTIARRHTANTWKPGFRYYRIKKNKNPCKVHFSLLTEILKPGFQGTLALMQAWKKHVKASSHKLQSSAMIIFRNCRCRKSCQNFCAQLIPTVALRSSATYENQARTKEDVKVC